MSQPKSIIGYVRIEGSSFVAGQGDEAGKGGFAGRLSHAYEGYTLEASRQFNDEGVELPCRVVTVAPKGEGGNALPIMAKTLSKTGIECPLTTQSNRRIHNVGIFVVGYWPSGWYQRHKRGTDMADRWRRALDTIEEVTERDNVTAVVLNEPRPTNDIRWGNGDTITDGEIEFFDDLAAITSMRVESWAEHYSFEDIWGVEGAEISDCLRPGDMHPTGTGYIHVARFLIKGLNSVFNINESLVPSELEGL